MYIDYKAHPILHVDDERANLITVRYCLEDEFTIVDTTSPEEALQILETQDVAVLLADQRMPGMSGSELAARARAIRPEVVRIIVTAYSDVHAVIDAINRGQVMRYVMKPWRTEEFRSIIRTGIEVYHLNRIIHDLEAKMLHTDRQATVQVLLAKVTQEVLVPLQMAVAEVEEIEQRMREVRHHVVAGPAAEPLDEAEASIGSLRLSLSHACSLLQRAKRSAVEAPAPAGVDLRKVVEAAVSIVRSELRSKAQLEIVADQSPLVVADPTQVGEILVNLLVNAADAIEGGAPAENRIEIRMGQSGGEAWLEIRDTGCGIAADQVERVFDPFYSTKNGKNSGLGLSIVRELAQKMGGRVTVQSEPGKGSTFRVELPAVPPDAAA